MPGGLFVLESVVGFHLSVVSFKDVGKKTIDDRVGGNQCVIGRISELAIFTLAASAFRIENKPT